MEERTRFQHIVLIILAALVVVFGLLTAVSRAHKGVQFDDALLKQTVTPEGTTYTGKIHGEAVTITVSGDVNITTVEYQTDTVRDVYIMEYPMDPIQTELGPVDGIRILKNGGVLFQGGYDAEQTYGWYGMDGQWDSGITVTVTTNGDQTPSGAPAELDRWDVVYFAQDPEPTARGSWMLYVLLVFLTGLLALDVAFPMTMFRLQHCCDVRDPEPSDFYLIMQSISWVLYPVLLLIGYVYALRMLPT